VCFDKRFLVSAHKALELKEKSFTTTLLVSPLKSQEQLKKSGAEFEAKHGVKFIAPDYRSGGGTQDQSRVTKEEQLYRQDYCGCFYGLSIQREQQNRLMDEIFSPISNKVLPASIEERLEIYKKRLELEEQKKEYKIVKEKFLNYRQFFCRIFSKTEGIIPAYALSYSTLTRKKAQGTIEFSYSKLHYFNREETLFITLEDFNFTCKKNYSSIKELIYNPLPIKQEQKIREKFLGSRYNLSPLFVVQTIPQSKIEIELDATIYEDTKEKLIII
jgi:epoxyqueuosine reductase